MTDVQALVIIWYSRHTCGNESWNLQARVDVRQNKTRSNVVTYESVDDGGDGSAA